MSAVVISLGLFAFWLLIGYAITSRCFPPRQAVRNMLLAPTIGLALTELLLFAGQRFGFSINESAGPLFGGLLALAVLGLAVARPPVQLRRTWPFAVVVCLAFGASGWPLIEHGHNWIGFASIDMSNYVMASAGFGDFCWEVSSADESQLALGLDYTHDIRKWYINSSIRCGSEIHLSAVAAVTRRSPLELVMVFPLAMHLVLVCAVGYLALRSFRRRSVALGTCVLVCVSSPLAYGLLDQMYGQVGGLALLCVGLGLLCAPCSRLPLYALVRRTVVGSVLCGGLLIHYPEVLPFLGAAFVGRVFVGMLRGRYDGKQFAVASVSGALGVGSLGIYGVHLLGFLLGQAQAGSNSGEHNTLHSWHEMYGSESYAALLWGVRTRFAEQLGELSRYDHLVTWVSIVGTVLFLCACAVGCYRRQPVWLTLASMAVVTVPMYRSCAWFGVYKMTMFAQPFLATALAGLALAAPARWIRVGVTAAALAVVIGNGMCQFVFTGNSLSAGGRCPFPGATETALVVETSEICSLPKDARLWVTTENYQLARFLVVPVRGRATAFTTERQFGASASTRSASDATYQSSKDGPQLVGGAPDWLANPRPTDYLVSSGPLQSAINYSRYPEFKTRNLFVAPLTEVRDHLVLRESLTSTLFPNSPPPPSAPDAPLAALGVTKDWLVRKHGRAEYLGRDLTVQVINPSPRVRLVLAVSSHMPVWEGALPRVTVDGSTLASADFVGRASGRIVTPPLVPNTEGAARLFRVRLDRANYRPWVPAPGATGVPQEHMAILCRDFSVVPEDVYARYTPPVSVAEFPKDLIDPLFEYSGLSEDGWTAEAVRVRLTCPRGQQFVELRGTVPDLDRSARFRTEATVLVDGTVVGTRELGCGEFALRFPAPDGPSGPRVVECRFSHTQPLSPPDHRRAAALISFVGFAPGGQ